MKSVVVFLVILFFSLYNCKASFITPFATNTTIHATEVLDNYGEKFIFMEEKTISTFKGI